MRQPSTRGLSQPSVGTERLADDTFLPEIVEFRLFPLQWRCYWRHVLLPCIGAPPRFYHRRVSATFTETALLFRADHCLRNDVKARVGGQSADFLLNQFPLTV